METAAANVSNLGRHLSVPGMVLIVYNYAPLHAECNPPDGPANRTAIEYEYAAAQSTPNNQPLLVYRQWYAGRRALCWPAPRPSHSCSHGPNRQPLPSARRPSGPVGMMGIRVAALDPDALAARIA